MIIILKILLKKGASEIPKGSDFQYRGKAWVNYKTIKI